MPKPVDIDSRLGELDAQELFHLETLRKRLQGAALTAKAVGETLPEAVLIGDEGSRLLSKSMTGITERAIESSVLEDPEKLSTALFPIIGAAIRKSMNKMLSEMMAAMNVGLESALSLKRLRWRIESLKTGIPFIEIVLRQTIRYRVEHVFLIHKKTGLLLREASVSGTGAADSDMVASMLEAVKAYIKDSLSLRASDAIDSIKAGDYSLLFEDGPTASIAAIVRGAPDGSIGAAMQEAIEVVHLRLGSKLKSFTGDTSPFEAADPLLERCLLSQDTRDPKAKPVYAIAALCAAAACAISLAVLGTVSAGERRAFELALNREDGIVVVSARRRFGVTELRALRDPRARSIESVAAEYGMDLAEFELDVESFNSPVLAGRTGASSGNLTVVPKELLDLAGRLAALRLLFEQDSGELRSGQEDAVMRAGDLVSELVDKAKAFGLSVYVEIVGHAAGRSQDDASQRVSEDRARKAMSLFIQLNAPLAEYIRPRGAGISEPVVAVETSEDDRISNRSVTFRAIFR